MHWQPGKGQHFVLGNRGISHKKACRLLKKWRAVQKGKGSRDEVREDIVAFLDATQISVCTPRTRRTMRSKAPSRYSSVGATLRFRGKARLL